MPGSHGSLTKAGKVRSQTPKVQAKVRKSHMPIIRNKTNYNKRVVNNQKVGQKS